MNIFPLVITLMWFTTSLDIKESIKPNPSMVQIEEESYKSFYNEKVKTYHVKNHGSKIGQSIWINRKGKKINAKYFAYKQNNNSIYSRFVDWKDSKNIVMACSGAYTYSNGNEHPTGITVDNGKLVNRSLRDDMDALVIVYATGGIVVSDIDNGDLYINKLGKKLNIRDRDDKYDFIDWAEEEQATVFQSHLLAYKNQLRIGTNSDRDKARRRVMVLVTNRNNEVYHVFFNIREEVRLYDISESLLNYLTQRNFNVIAMVNLDTGSYDIMEVYDEQNDIVSGIKGDPNFSVRKATNLITYYVNE